MNILRKLAPAGEAVVEYDRQHLALYAALLEADDAGCSWQEAAEVLMHLDTSANDTKTCWRSHLERAIWIVNEGLGSALETFSRRRP
jgi:hypothetical protein